MPMSSTTLPPTSERQRSRTPRAGDRSAEFALLRRLWEQQQAHAEQRGGDEDGLAYLRSHFATNVVLERHLRVLDWMTPHIHGRVLEWGCRHGLDSCVYRLRCGSSVELHGCDVCDGDAYQPFHAFSGLQYRRLAHPWRLAYPDNEFDVVTSNGVLEHVPDDVASLRELFRVLRPGGALVISCLPNRYSYTEALQRWRGVTAHDRLYTIRSIRAKLRNAGFVVLDARRFLMVPTMLHGVPTRIRSAYERAGRLVWALNDALERLWPIQLLASNLLVLARRPA